jgi:endonuclease/exonuclease/phosphatase family metal-dependent hydrolase
VIVRALSWNLFHGRDFPPNPALFTCRSRLFRGAESDGTYVQVNRDLEREFAAVVGAAEWNVALLQECPPRWWESLARACDAAAHGALTSRNSLAGLRSLLARLNPDLIASNEGGSNLTLARDAEIIERRERVLRPGPLPERRLMAFSHLRIDGFDLAVANLHLSAGARRRALAEAELRAAARTAVEWADGVPLLLGGDLNLRPPDTDVYARLERELGWRGHGGAGSLDHLLARDLEPLAPAAALPPSARELRVKGGTLRLSDHAPVVAAFAAEVASPPRGE